MKNEATTRKTRSAKKVAALKPLAFLEIQEEFGLGDEALLDVAFDGSFADESHFSIGCYPYSGGGR